MAKAALLMVTRKQSRGTRGRGEESDLLPTGRQNSTAAQMYPAVSSSTPVGDSYTKQVDIIKLNHHKPNQPFFSPFPEVP